MRFDFVGQTAKDSTNRSGNPSRLVNCYREAMVPGGRSSHSIRSVPGMRAFVTLGRSYLRCMTEFRGALIAVSGGHLYGVSEEGEVLDIGRMGDATDASISVNTDQVTVVSGGRYYTYFNELVERSSGAISSVGSVAYLGGYTVLSELNGRRIQWSALADPTSMPPLNFATAEITDDDVMRIMVVGDVLFVFKRSGFERWAVTGLADASAFARISGAEVQTGLKAYGLVTAFPNGLSFVGQDGRVYVWGGSLMPISTPALEDAIEHCDPQTMFYYEQRGHGFICLTFTDCAAWCYDVASGEWHEREQDEGPWLARAAIRIWGQWGVGTVTGQVAQLSPICSDFGKALTRRAVSLPMEREGNEFSLDMVEAITRTGLDNQNLNNAWAVLDDGASSLSADAVRYLGDDGAWNSGNAKLELRTSRDGVQFGQWKARDVGAKGHYRTRLTWRGLGLFRLASVEFRLSSLNDIPLMSTMNVEVS